MLRRPPTPTLFPYTTLFRSKAQAHVSKVTARIPWNLLSTLLFSIIDMTSLSHRRSRTRRLVLFSKPTGVPWSVAATTDTTNARNGNAEKEIHGDGRRGGPEL